MDYDPYSAPLSLQIDNGLDLAQVDQLRLYHIAQLEYIDKWFNDPLIMAWTARIEAAVRFRALPLPAGERPYHRMDNTWPFIHRDAYRTWRATQPDAPAGSYIHLWLGHAPAPAVPALPQREPAPPPPDEPAPPSGVVIEAPAYQARAPRIDQRVAAIVDALKARGIDPLAVPTGIKAEIKHQLCTPPQLGLTSQKGGTFDKAWQVAVARNQVRMAEHDRFCPM